MTLLVVSLLVVILLVFLALLWLILALGRCIRARVTALHGVISSGITSYWAWRLCALLDGVC